MSFFSIFLLSLLSTAISIPPPANPALLAQPPPTRNVPLHLRNVTHNSCCISGGLTFDPCTTLVPCAYGRYCVTPDSLHPCPPGVVCICYPSRIILCQDPAHCPPGETCAYRPHDHHPFCVSINVVDVDPSYLIFRGGCLPCSTSRPPTVTPYSPPPVAPSTESATPSPSPPGRVPTEPPTQSPPVQPPTLPPTQRPTTKPPTTAPPSRPQTAIQPSKRPSPTPLKSAPPSPRESPLPPPPQRPSHRPTIAVVSPSDRPSPRPATTGPITPSPTPAHCLAGDPCSEVLTCCGYRKCRRKDTLTDCNGHSDCICLGSRVCVCNDQCTDGEVCAGAPGKSYCFSPRLIDALSWSTTLPCVGPAVSPEVGGSTRPPTTTPPAEKIPGLTGDKCRIDANCRQPRTCIAGGGESCMADQVLCDKDPTPCERGDATCYCYMFHDCNCNNDCKDTEICTATAKGRICVSRTLLSQSESVQEIECPGTGEDGKPILIVNEPQPEPPAAVTGTPRPTPSPVRIPGVTPQVIGQDAEGGDGVCIDIGALTGFQAHELVFEKHRLARVLCDANNSCATPGHIVVYQGNAMMMKSYCKTVGCVNKITRVNSPSLQRRLRVPSNSDGLEFTAFAARYETKTEELMLATAVRVGL